ncbi:uncharacterized protein BDW43DRAFT_303558 [Aspergillus alliaceus]|uniref:uncharacterized protein n=1 Tax=Petromyces alliaceus TaxID=209559 RepID=UPI0012A4F437|nr:uncharacterized protein BDW43DRAFT_303558 [Aspergillus alliaceus]KAB8228857.1 hypothetical protein BDW43DRAFT_303558 [Aspergillus alliaceus]
MLLSSAGHDDYTAVWICTLPLELAAAYIMLDRQHVKDHNTVIACLFSRITGTVSAARVISQILSTFRQVKFRLIIRIGGGVPSEEHDIRLEDVMVRKPVGLLEGVIQYDFGKTIQQGQFQRKEILNKSLEILLTVLSNLQAQYLIKGHGIKDTIQNIVN